MVWRKIKILYYYLQRRYQLWKASRIKIDVMTFNQKDMFEVYDAVYRTNKPELKE